MEDLYIIEHTEWRFIYYWTHWMKIYIEHTNDGWRFIFILNTLMMEHIYEEDTYDKKTLIYELALNEPA